MQRQSFGPGEARETPLDPQFWAVSPLPPFDWVFFLLWLRFTLRLCDEPGLFTQQNSHCIVRQDLCLACDFSKHHIDVLVRASCPCRQINITDN
jgi:hypothetical protein